MRKDIVVDVASRSEFGKNVSRRLRRGGRIPAVLYGESKAPVHLAVDPKAIAAILSSEGGENTLFQLRLDSQAAKTRHVMIREHQVDPVKGSLVHVDFIRVAMDRAVEVEVPLHVIGVAEGVKNEGGLMDFVVRTVQVSCLPGDIPERLPVDVSSLHVGQVFRVKDLTADPKVRFLTDPDQALVVIGAKAAEAAAPEGAVAEPEAATAEPAAAEAEGGGPST